MSTAKKPKDSIVLQTAKKHFSEDLRRARAILEHAKKKTAGLLKDDLCRSAWMFGVGSLDAYFSDAYADLVARTLRAKQKEPKVEIPNRLENLKVPAITVIDPDPKDGWRWRMAARALIEEDNVLSLEKVRSLFNQFFLDENNKLFSHSRIETWINDPASTARLFGITKAKFGAIPAGKDKNKAIKNAKSHMEDKRFKKVFQRRHDCIHNCDRPRSAPQNPIDPGTVANALRDIEFLVSRCHVALVAEYPKYLKELGFNATTRNQVGASK